MVNKKEEQSFGALFDQSFEAGHIKEGDIISGKVVNIDNKFVTIDVGLKSDGVVPVSEFVTNNGQIGLVVGDKVDVILEMIADDFGETRLSREKAKRMETWNRLLKAYESGTTVKGFVLGKVKGGMTIDIEGVKAFLPGSLVDVHVAPEMLNLEGKETDLKIIKVDYERNNIVVSRRAVIEEASHVERSKLLRTLEEGQILKGIVKNITDYGAFVDIGGIDGLVHIKDMSWDRVKPSEMLTIGTEVTVVVLKIDRDNNRISLGMKQLSADPWMGILANFPKGTLTKGTVTNITDYGCFVSIAAGIEGLVHTSELDWTNKNVHPGKLVKVGDEVQVKVLEVDEERRRISLSIKQCAPNPWTEFAEKHQVGEAIKGSIKSITDFGLFVGLEGNIDGLVHLSDLSWTEPGEKAIRLYKKGDELEAMIINIDAEKERISLGVKQLQNDPFGNFASANERGTVVKGIITEITANQALVQLAPEVLGCIKASDYGDGTTDDLTQSFKVGDELEAKVAGINHKDRFINLVTRLTEESAEAKAPKTPRKAPAKKVTTIDTSLGSVIKEQLENQEKLKKEQEAAEEALESEETEEVETEF